MLPRKAKLIIPPLYTSSDSLYQSHHAHIIMSDPYISPPLPLPIGFKLLPSLLPGNQLTPCLYTEIVRPIINELTIDDRMI